ncbi:MAG: hypothetical protein ABEI96_05520 [Haloarculaceae archaeon]
MTTEATRTEAVYEIHLVEGTGDVPATVTTERLDYYDSGVWTALDESGTREFFPYHRITFIRETTESETAGSAGSGTGGVEEDADSIE